MADDLDDLGPLARTIEPLPGGLAALRRRLREPRRALPIGLALAAACCAALAIWLTRDPPRAPADRTAMRRLLVDGADLPNPRAVELGLVERGRPVVTSDPRVAPSDAVVFYWVAPAR